MGTISKILVVLVALEHLYFLYLEMVAWTKPSTLKAFGTTLEQAESSKPLAANQGLYNGFLAAGLLWGVIYPDVAIGHQIQLFFLGCVIVATLLIPILVLILVAVVVIVILAILGPAIGNIFSNIVVGL